MPSSLDLKDCKELLQKLFVEKSNEILKPLAYDNLTIKNDDIVIEECNNCKKKLNIRDSGLYEDNIALFWKSCEGMNRGSHYCAGIDESCDITQMGSYKFCYNKISVDAIERAIIISDFIRAIDISAYNVLNICIKRTEHDKYVNKEFIIRNFNGIANRELKRRRRMWYEINEGLRRLLVMPSDPTKNDGTLIGEIKDKNGFNMRVLHGHQLRELVRQNSYSVQPIKEDLISFGHYHLQMVLWKYDTWVLGTGHFTLYKNPRKRGFLSHLGAPILRFEEGIPDPVFILRRFYESDAQPIS